MMSYTDNEAISTEYLELISQKASDVPLATRHEFIQSMQNAILVSQYKYGPIANKPATLYSKLGASEREAMNIDHNLEHCINIANYAMFRYILNDPNVSRDTLINTGVTQLRHYAFPKEGESLTHTDSDKSVITQNITLRQQMYSDLLGSLFNPIDYMY